MTSRGLTLGEETLSDMGLAEAIECPIESTAFCLFARFVAPPRTP